MHRIAVARGSAPVAPWSALVGALVTVMAFATLAACGPRAVAPVPDYGPPPAPVDPIACPAARLEQLATRVGTTAQIATEPMVDAARVDKVPCKDGETDDACLARARKRPAPVFYEVTSVTIGGDIADVEYTYDLDGRRITEHAASMTAMVARLKALQAKGHKVTLIRGTSAADAGSRHAAIAYKGVGGQERRVATLRLPATDEPARVMAEVHAAAERDRIELRSMELDDSAAPRTIVVVATCGP